MNVLIDTHIFLWALAEPKRLNSLHKRELVSPANRAWLSSISIVELMIKSSIGKLQIDFDPVEQAETIAYRKQRLWVIDCMKRISSIVKRFISILFGFFKVYRITLHKI